jgi:hypothetical protein
LNIGVNISISFASKGLKNKLPKFSIPTFHPSAFLPMPSLSVALYLLPSGNGAASPVHFLQKF